MTVFWSLAAVMMVVALLFTIPWLLRGNRSLVTDPDAVNTDVIKAQLAELKADLEAGRLAEAQYVAARQDLERELLDDLSRPVAGGTGGKVRGGQWLAVLLVLLIPGLAVSLYHTIGTKQIIPLLERSAALPGNKAATPPGSQSETATGEHSLDDMIAKLAERLRANPDDLRGWMLLARSFESVKRFPDAANAYANAYRINADHPDVLAGYADALVMANGGRFNEQAGGLLERAVEIQPDHIKSLWLMGHWKNQEGAYPEAIEHWQRAAALLPAGSQDAGVITQQIQVARGKLGTAAGTQTPAVPATTPPAAEDTAAAGQGIQVTVALDSGLAAQAAPGDTVFIFARALLGPRMPLAIVRKQVSDLPVSVTLDDSLAMTPAMVLSKFAEVTVGARISKSGNAIPQSGDLQGSMAPVDVTSDAPVEITIDSVVP